MAEIIDEDNLLGNEGLYVELSPDGKIKRHLNANGKEIPLSDTTIAEELIQLTERTFEYVSTVSITLYESLVEVDKDPKGFSKYQKYMDTVLLEMETADVVSGTLTKTMLSDMEEEVIINGWQGTTHVLETVKRLNWVSAVQYGTSSIFDDLCEGVEPEFGMDDIRRVAVTQIITLGSRLIGELGHIELDSVTFERGKPKPLNMEGAPKYVASEMCQVFASHWGYAANDFNYKSPAELIRDLTVCRRCGSNLLMNVGPMGNGKIHPLDRGIFELLGRWVQLNAEAIYEPRPSGIDVENKPEDFILRNGSTYYLFCDKLPMVSDPNVELLRTADYRDVFTLNKKIKSVHWLDNNEELSYEQEENRVIVYTVPYRYGNDLVVRVAKIETE